MNLFKQSVRVVPALVLGCLSASCSTPAEAPAWARAMKHRQTITHGATMASHTLKGGDSHGGGSGPDIADKS